ncbi:MAG: hypothetical protein HOQ07_00195 [Sinomonas sp.]|nr:hypothetical protein [Sinomonas sp.]
MATWTRRTRFELVRRVPLRFPTYHPQGLALSGGRVFLSTVELTERPESIPGHHGDPARRTPGAGRGHVLVLEPDGTLMADIALGDGEAYHPGGIDTAAGLLWVPVAEYRAESRTVVYTIDLRTLRASARFTVDDHVSWLTADPEARTLYGGSWGSRRLFRWTLKDGRVGEAATPDAWDNPSAYIDFQDAQYDGGGQLLCGGIAELRGPSGEVFELGGIAVVRPSERRIAAEVPVPAFSSAGHTILRNPFVLTRDAEGMLLHVAPDDGDEPGGTELLTYRVRHDLRPAARSGKLRALT